LIKTLKDKLSIFKEDVRIAVPDHNKSLPATANTAQVAMPKAGGVGIKMGGNKPTGIKRSLLKDSTNTETRVGQSALIELVLSNQG
jgi:hypothetical protein